MNSRIILGAAVPVVAAAALTIGATASVSAYTHPASQPAISYIADGEDGPGDDYANPESQGPGGDNTGTHAVGNGLGAGVTTGGAVSGTNPGTGDSPDLSSAYPGGGNEVPTPEGGAIGTGEGVPESP